MSRRELLRSLGIPADYGLRPPLPQYAEAEALVTVAHGVSGAPQRLAPETAADWIEMHDAAASDGIVLQLVSGYRSVARQTELFRRKLAAGQEIGRILEVNTAPGFSQHHTGQAVDISTPGFEPLTEAFCESPAFGWLQARAVEFGFRMPYDRGNRFGILYEPWHWSQLGDEVNAAADQL